MQATASRTPTAPDHVAGALLELWQHLIRHSGQGVFALFGELDLSLTQLKTLTMLDALPAETSVKELAETLGLSLPGTSRNVEGLLQRGYVERREDPDDRRMKRVGISPVGRELVQRIERARLQGLEAWAATLPPAQREALAAAITPILADLPEARA